MEPTRGTLVGRTLLEKQVVHIHDIQADREYTLDVAKTLGRNRTMLGIPLMRDGAPIGVIALQRSVVQPFTSQQIHLVETFADQAVIAVENARLVRELQESLSIKPRPATCSTSLVARRISCSQFSRRSSTPRAASLKRMTLPYTFETRAC